MFNLTEKIEKIKARKFFRYGIPFMLLVVGGSFVLKEFTIVRYKFSRKQPVSPEEMKKYGVSMKKQGEVTLESEYNKVKNLDIENWEQIRGPRPWEEKT